ncbi:MAG: hypothetical protein HYU41_03195 [Candidatus Rokubacteria bacterium]|nr:hypothetical protein [Candidatus Rokubacteria bacterium]
MKKKDLRESFLGLDLSGSFPDDFKQRFHRLVADEKITDAKQVRDLPAILANPDATKALESKGFAEATRVLITNDPSLESDLFWAVKTATEKLKAAPASDIQDLKGGNPQKLIMLRNLYRAIDDLATLAGVKL